MNLEIAITRRAWDNVGQASSRSELRPIARGVGFQSAVEAGFCHAPQTLIGSSASPSSQTLFLCSTRMLCKFSEAGFAVTVAANEVSPFPITNLLKKMFCGA